MKLIKKALKHDFFPVHNCELLGEEKTISERLKMISIYVFNEAIIKYGQGLKNEQMILEDLADIFTALFTLESTLIRITKKDEDKLGYDPIEKIIARIMTIETTEKVLSELKRIILGSTNKTELKSVLEVYYKYSENLVINDNIYELKRQIADHLYEKNEYPF